MKQVPYSIASLEQPPKSCRIETMTATGTHEPRKEIRHIGLPRNPSKEIHDLRSP